MYLWLEYHEETLKKKNTLFLRKVLKETLVQDPFVDFDSTIIHRLANKVPQCLKISHRKKTKRAVFKVGIRSVSSIWRVEVKEFKQRGHVHGFLIIFFLWLSLMLN